MAVWVEAVPTDDAQALEIYERFWNDYLKTENTDPPSPRIRECIAALTQRYPDLTDLRDEDVDDSPWSDGPLTGNVMGTFF